MGGSTATYTQPPDNHSNDPSWHRADGSLKGNGFLGLMANRGNPGTVSSEISVGVNPSDISPTTKANTPEGYTDIPSMVPTLNENEKSYLLDTPEQNLSKNNPSLFGHIQDKAISFARQRQAQGHPFFATPEESPVAQPRMLITPTLAPQ